MNWHKGLFSDLFEPVVEQQKPIGSGSLVIRFYNGAVFDLPITTKIAEPRRVFGQDSWGKPSGIMFKTKDASFTVRPKPAPDFQI